jgi:hypothetical protein
VIDVKVGQRECVDVGAGSAQARQHIEERPAVDPTEGVGSGGCPKPRIDQDAASVALDQQPTCRHRDPSLDIELLRMFGPVRGRDGFEEPTRCQRHGAVRDEGERDVVHAEAANRGLRVQPSDRILCHDREATRRRVREALPTIACHNRRP